MAAAGPPATNGERLRRATDPMWVRIAMVLVLAATLVRLFVSGPLVYLEIPANVQNLVYEFDLIVDHIPVTVLGARGYGVVSWLLYDPAIRLFGRDPLAINLWALALSLLAAVGSLVLVAIRLGARRPVTLAALAIMWAGFLPIVSTLAERSVDLLNHAWLAIAFFLYTGTVRQRPWSGAAAAAGAMTKFLPGLFIPFFLIRDRRAFAYSVVTVAFLIVVGQVLYGPMMGIGYFSGVASATSIEQGWSGWHEGFSPRQLLFKLAAGYQLHNVNVEPANPQLLTLVAYAIELGAAGYLLYVGFRSRGVDDLEARAIQFALGIATIYMVSPTVGREHIVSMIIVYTVLAWYWLRSTVAPPRALIALAIASLALIGVYLPLPIVGKVLPMDAVLRLAGNATTAPWIFDYPIAQYDFLGFPGYGAIIAWIVMVIVERGTRSTEASSSR